MGVMKELLEQLNEVQLWEMANLRPKRTGLPVIVYVSERNSSHGPRIKFMNGYSDNLQLGELLTMTVEDSPRVIGNVKISARDVKLIKQWVLLNKQLLIDLWNNKIDEVDFVNNQKRL